MISLNQTNLKGKIHIKQFRDSIKMMIKEFTEPWLIAFSNYPLKQVEQRDTE